MSRDTYQGKPIKTDVSGVPCLAVPKGSGYRPRLGRPVEDLENNPEIPLYAKVRPRTHR